MQLSVIVSTYNQPEWLEKVLHGYLRQTHRDFEILIADDGSDERTFAVLERFRPLAWFPLSHIWHEDEGYRRQTILNVALQKVAHSYIVMTDGDCIPREDFLEIHARNAAPGTFLSGGYCKLPMELSKAITLGEIESGMVFDAAYLRENGLRELSPTVRVALPPFLGKTVDTLTPTKPTWNNCNASGWTEDLLAVNGFNEDMQYGGADRELGERLANRGIRGVQIRNQAIALHLDHKRGYKTPETMEKNMAIRREVVASGSTWCANGISKRPHP